MMILNRNEPGIMKNKNEVEFAFFCVESIAEKIEKDPVKVFDALTKKSKILYEYVIPCYDVLHTQGKDYIVDDILSFMTKKGVEV